MLLCYRQLLLDIVKIVSMFVFPGPSNPKVLLLLEEVPLCGRKHSHAAEAFDQSGRKVHSSN